MPAFWTVLSENVWAPPVRYADCHLDGIEMLRKVKSEIGRLAAKMLSDNEIGEVPL